MKWFNFADLFKLKIIFGGHFKTFKKSHQIFKNKGADGIIDLRAFLFKGTFDLLRVASMVENQHDYAETVHRIARADEWNHGLQDVGEKAGLEHRVWNLGD